MSEWSETTLGALYTEPTERKVPEPSDQRYVGLEHIDPDSPSVSRWAEATSATSLSKVFRTDDVLFGRLRPYLHKVARADFDGVCTGEIFVLRATDAVLPKFLYLLAASDRVLARAVEVSAGTRMPRVSASDLAAIPVALPSLPTQERIVEVIGAVDDQIAALDTEASAGAAVRAVLLNDLLTGASETWTEATLGDIAALSIGRTPDRKNATYWTSDTSHPFCTIADMPVESWNINPQREGVTEAAIRDGKAKLAPAGSLLMSFKLTIGRVGFAERDVYPNEAIVRIEPCAGVSPRFLALWLESRDLTENAPRAVKGKTLNSMSLAAIRVLLPKRDVQDSISDTIEAVDQRIASARVEAGRLRAVRASLLSALLNRDIDVDVVEGVVA